MKKKILFAWSGGKDSSLALYRLVRSDRYEIVSLLTTVTDEYDRISMHGVRSELLAMQAASIGLPLREARIPAVCSNLTYAETMRDILLDYKASGVDTVAFGDIFLEDVREYREKQLAEIDMRPLFPLWGEKSTSLAEEFIDLGFSSVISCVDSHALGKKFCGREYDRDFIRELPKSVDVCGEKGEFHSFVYSGPLFSKPVDFLKGGIVLRDGRFFYCDLIAARS